MARHNRRGQLSDTTSRRLTTRATPFSCLRSTSRTQAPTVEDVSNAIDTLDGPLVSLLAEHERLVRTAAGLESSPSQAAVPNRAENVLNRAADLATDKGAGPQAVGDIYTTPVSSFIASKRRHESGR